MSSQSHAVATRGQYRQNKKKPALIETPVNKSVDKNKRSNGDLWRLTILKMLVASSTALENRLRTKVMIRHLPGTIDPGGFIHSLMEMLRRIPKDLSELIENSILWCHLVPYRHATDVAAGVAYITFANKTSAKLFIDSYHGYKFIDHHGLVTKAICGLATFHRSLIPLEIQPGSPLFHGQRGSVLQYYLDHPDVLTMTAYVDPNPLINTYATDHKFLDYMDSIKDNPNLRETVVNQDDVYQSNPEDEVVSPVVKAAMKRRMAKKSKQKSQRHNNTDKEDTKSWSHRNRSASRSTKNETNKATRNKHKRSENQLKSAASASPHVRRNEQQ